MNKILRYSFMALLAMICNISFAQTEFDFDTNGTTLLGISGESSNDSQAGDITEAKTATVGDFSVTVSPAAEGAGTPNRIWNKSPKLRMYSGTLTVSTGGSNIKTIVFTTTKFDAGNTASTGTLGTLENGTVTWTGDVQDEVVFTIAKNTQISKITINAEATPDPEPEPTPSGSLTGAGTLESPYTATDACIVASKLADKALTDADYYVKGKISQIKYTFSAGYGTATFSISDDGTTNNEFMCYAVYYLENKSWIEGYTQVKVGDEVIVYGKLTNYGGTYETASKKAYIYSLNGQTKAEDTPDPEPTTVEEVTVAKALELISALADGAKTDKEYKVKGYIVGTPEFQRKDDNSLYGNVNTTIADEKGGATTLTIYRARSFENEVFTEETISLLKEGDEVVFQGKLQKYVKNDTTTPELTNGWLVSVNGQSSDINAVKAAVDSNAPVYNLAGQKVSASYKGLVIKGGKKFFNK